MIILGYHHLRKLPCINSLLNVHPLLYHQCRLSFHQQLLSCYGVSYTLKTGSSTIQYRLKELQMSKMNPHLPVPYIFGTSWEGVLGMFWGSKSLNTYSQGVWKPREKNNFLWEHHIFCVFSHRKLHGKKSAHQPPTQSNRTKPNPKQNICRSLLPWHPKKKHTFGELHPPSQ